MLTSEEKPELQREIERDIQQNTQPCGRGGEQNTTTQKHHIIKQTNELFTWNKEGYQKCRAFEIKLVFNTIQVPLPEIVDSITLVDVKHHKKQPMAAIENWPNYL